MSRATRKAAFYGQKLLWLAGRSHFDTPVGPLEIPRSVVSPLLFYHLVAGDYEGPERRLLERHLGPNDRVIELGGGIGFLANVYGRRAPAERHLAIEASPVMCNLIRSNTSALQNVDVLNAVAARVATAEGAGAAATSMPFHVYEDYWASSLEPLHERDASKRLLRTERVPVVDLDALIVERRCTLLVCDIEGGEYDLFRAFAVDVQTIVLELHWAALGVARALEILKRLDARGYTLEGTPDVLIATKR